MVLKRGHVALEEQTTSEAERRARAERDLIELEAKTRGRLLYLEMWKQGAMSHLTRMGTSLQASIPEAEHAAAKVPYCTAMQCNANVV